MPSYRWLSANKLDPLDVAPKMRALRKVGVPYTDAEIAQSAAEITDKTEQDALVAYLQVLGTAIKNKN